MTQDSKVLGVIPARFQSKRFPGKVLATVGDRSLLQWVYENSSRCSQLDDLIIATDDERVFQEAQSLGAKAMMTLEDCRTGSDRVAEVAQKIEANLVLNIQADYPDIHPEDLDTVIQFLRSHPDVSMATLRQPFRDKQEILSPHHVKVYSDSQDFALNFTRVFPALEEEGECAEHIGVYGFQREALLKFSGLEQSPREKEEKLEQLRALENDMAIKVLSASQRCHGINVPEDIPRFLKDCHCEE